MSKQKSWIFSDPVYRNLVSRVLRENFHLYVRQYVMAFILMGIGAAATGFTAYLIKRVVTVVLGSNEVLEKSAASGKSHVPGFLRGVSDWAASFFPSASSTIGMATIIGVAFTIALVFLAKGLSQYGSTVILSRIGNNIVARQQRLASQHILRQSLAFFVRFPSSDLIPRVSQATSAAREVMNLMMTRVQDVFTAISLLVTMFALDWRLSLAAIFIMAPVTLGLAALVKRVRKIANAEYQGIMQVVSAIQEAIMGNKLIKAYNLEQHMTGRFDEAIEAVEFRGNKLAKVNARSSPLMETMGGFAIAIMVCYGGYRNLQHPGDSAAMMAFLGALLFAYEPIKRIAKMNVALQSSLVGVRMLYDMLDTNCTIPDSPNATDIRVSKGEIRLRELTFGYREGLPVLHQVSLVCPPGQVTALVGPSGSGKSTILNLIERFYQPEHGGIEIDGRNVADVTTVSLRQSMSLVSQDTFLFSDTLRNNIRLARPDATDAEVEAAARAASAHDFIMAQPQGYDTQAGENGGNLSGGQRQRISIARAFLKDAPILLLDEATSALDSESERQIQEAFDRLMKGRTTIVIAHRFSTIRSASVIHVMDGGRVVESGSHRELIANPNNLYSYLYRLQYEREAEEG